VDAQRRLQHRVERKLGDQTRMTTSQLTKPVSAGVDRRSRLRGSRRKVVVTVHISAALGLLGASLALVVGGLHAATRDDPGDAHAIYTLLRLLTFSVDIPLAVITLLAGLTLALTLKWRIFRYPWVMGKLALYLATLTVGVTLIGPAIDTMLDVTEVGNPGEHNTRWTLVVLAGTQVTMLLAAATLAVFKPGQARAGRSSALRPRTGEGAQPQLPRDETEAQTR
jgi:hypothetical protein